MITHEVTPGVLWIYQVSGPRLGETLEKIVEDRKHGLGENFVIAWVKYIGRGGGRICRADVGDEPETSVSGGVERQGISSASAGLSGPDDSQFLSEATGASNRRARFGERKTRSKLTESSTPVLQITHISAPTSPQASSSSSRFLGMPFSLRRGVGSERTVTLRACEISGTLSEGSDESLGEFQDVLGNCGDRALFEQVIRARNFITPIGPSESDFWHPKALLGNRELDRFGLGVNLFVDAGNNPYEGMTIQNKFKKLLRNPDQYVDFTFRREATDSSQTMVSL